MYLVLHSKVMGRERQHSGQICFYWDERWAPRISQAHSLLVSLKHKSKNFKHKKKSSGLYGQLSKSNDISKSKEPPSWEVRGPGALSSCVAGIVFFQIAIFEEDASLKLMPWESNLKSGSCITK